MDWESINNENTLCLDGNLFFEKKNRLIMAQSAENDLWRISDLASPYAERRTLCTQSLKANWPVDGTVPSSGKSWHTESE